MESSFTIEFVSKQILDSAVDRYQANSDDLICDLFLGLSPDLEQKQVIRLRRFTNRRNAWRTLLIAIVTQNDELEKALGWAAMVKEELLNSEPADLYLLVISTGFISPEKCINIEADERYCRKYVLKPKESISQLLNRCFLYQKDDDEQIGSLADPLREALIKTGIQYEWFEASKQERWKSAFLSGNNGIELAELLFQEP